MPSQEVSGLQSLPLHTLGIVTVNWIHPSYRHGIAITYIAECCGNSGQVFMSIGSGTFTVTTSAFDLSHA